MNMDRILRDMEAKFIGFAKGDSRFGSSSGHPHGEGLGVMIPSTATV